MEYHLEIVNNETGEVVHEMDTNCIVAGIMTKEGPASLGLCKADDFDIAATIVAASESASKIMDDTPNIKSIAKYLQGVHKKIHSELEKLLGLSKEDFS